MNVTQAKKQIAALIKQIDEHNHNYYVLNEPRVSDQEYDRLLKELIELEEAFPQLKSMVSPSHRVGAKVEGHLPTVTHRVKMLSLDNTYSLDELEQWYDRAVRGLDGIKPELVAELKIDGLSCALTYRNGDLILAATRGDGVTGEDVTHNAKTIHSIPLRLKGKAPTLFDIRGEVYMDKEDFAALNQQRKKDSEELFANPRNAAAGSLKLLDSRLTAQRKLKFLAHSFGLLEGGQKVKTQWEFLQQAKSYGFSTSPHSRLFKTLDEAKNYCGQCRRQREATSYEVDGVVIKINHLGQQQELGTTLKSPRWAVAFKFPGYQATTTIKDIVVQIGRTGVLTPVAELEPVPCGGVVISRATLHNFDEIKRLKVNAQDRVLLERAGDVIPKIIKVVEKHSKGDFIPPKVCPFCGGKIQKEKEQDVAYRCINPFCSKQLERLLVHFASRQAMDIEGLGESVVGQLLAKGLVKSPADFYSLTQEQLLSLDLFAVKKADNLLKAIEQSKEQPLSRLLYGLGIANIGVKAAVNLARHFRSLDVIIKASTQDLQAMEEFGPVMAESVAAYFQQPQVKALLSRLKSFGVNIKEPQIVSAGHRLQGKAFIFTGELSGLARAQATEMVEVQGGRVVSAISNNVDYVVAGENPGSKLAQARKLGIKILDQKQFEEMVHG